MTQKRIIELALLGTERKLALAQKNNQKALYEEAILEHKELSKMRMDILLKADEELKKADMEARV